MLPEPGNFVADADEDQCHDGNGLLPMVYPQGCLPGALAITYYTVMSPCKDRFREDASEKAATRLSSTVSILYILAMDLPSCTAYGEQRG